jgi:hypothetical protein
MENVRSLDFVSPAAEARGSVDELPLSDPQNSGFRVLVFC